MNEKANCSLYETFSPDVGCVRYARDFYFSDDLYQIAINITDPAGYTTSYGYNARWLPETIIDTYNTTATTPWRKPAIGQPQTAKASNKPTTSTATKSVSRAR